jgi:hypothetical protein
MVPLLWVLLDDDGQPRTSTRFSTAWSPASLPTAAASTGLSDCCSALDTCRGLSRRRCSCCLVAYQALTFGLFAVIVCRLRMHIGVKVTWLAPLVWVACELCVPYVFPWYLAITQAWVPTVIQIADITGPLGVSFLLVLSNGALFDVLHALGRSEVGATAAGLFWERP